jgi:4-amino-4-deoxy-L-arabinose transferase-like glycosyltransferase
VTSDAEERSITPLVLATILVCAIALFGRMAAPSDLWDQTQPRTVAYTADILTRGGEAWLLAQDASGLFATKPPLYNWLAAPCVALFGRACELAHRLPSVLASLVIILLLVRWGERIGRGVGWLAAIAWVAMFPAIKLGYLARPDMLLCLELLVGWYAVTQVLIDARLGRNADLRIVLVAWAAFVLATWTKGPASLVLPAYAVAAAWAITGSPGRVSLFRPFSIGVVGVLAAFAWYFVAAWIAPDHFRDTLVYGEVVGRMTGNGPEGGKSGPIAILTGLPVMGLYFLARFAPWSFAAVAGAVVLVRRPRGEPRSWEIEQPMRAASRASWRPLLWGAVLWCATIIALYSLSSGKRADYIAPAYAPAALVAAWWMLTHRHSPIRHVPWLAGVIAVITAAVHVAVLHRGGVMPREAMETVDAITARIPATRPQGDPAPLLIVTDELPHAVALHADLPPAANTVERVVSEFERTGHVYAAFSAKSPPKPIGALIRRGQGRVLWSAEMPEAAAAAGMSHPITMVELRSEMAARE